MITMTAAIAQITPEIHHLPEATPTMTAAIVKMRGGTIRLVSIRTERNLGESRFHSYAGGANSSSITKFRLRAAGSKRLNGGVWGRRAADHRRFLLDLGPRTDTPPNNATPLITRLGAPGAGSPMSRTAVPPKIPAVWSSTS